MNEGQGQLVQDENISMNEKIEQTEDVVITKLESKGGKQYVKESDLEGMSDKELQKYKQELKMNKRENKQEIRKVDKQLKSLRSRNIQKRGGYSKFDPKENPNN